MAAMGVGEIARRWRLLQGSNNWAGLLDPLDLDLRKNILLYGDHAQATYDTFNSERRSKYAGSSRYGKRDFFNRVGLTNNGYQISRFLYATSKITVPEAFLIRSLSREAWSSESNWMGYVAVTSQGGPMSKYGRRDITISWRGSVQTLEWIEDFNPQQVPISSLLPVGGSSFLDESVDKAVRGGGVKVHRGWFEIYTSDDPKSPFNKSSARDQVFAELKQLLEVFKYERHELSITLTGHSLGAALATLCGFDIVINGLNRLNDGGSPIPVTVIAFASPKVGNSEFKQSVVKLLPELKILRVKNSPDLVPLYPVVGYEDVGVEIKTNTGDSPFLKDSGNASNWHNLDAYLHAAAGMQGKGDFKLVVDRDVALVNKHLDWLKEEELVPGSWWIEKNKGMVQSLDRHWRMESLADQDIPRPEDALD
ncbi:hypothetical protein SUGI_0788270 [Cryptomeria japonica]|uniref:phospholipase A1-II 1-like n=1 Tax=Cryptomeria japonica TaxID=3369 RepID=UPI00241481B7|nr:phospholipase A1-II 1-like [Cryptomeria japonica]GLJ38669.1 hypothetical protein SUGI_0788270 [Cryptomeria japonica]